MKTVEARPAPGSRGHWMRELALRNIDRSGYILVVEDDEDVRDVIATILREEEYEVVRVTGVEEAWQHVSVRQPRLVLLDLALEGRTAADFVTTYRQVYG